MTPEFTPISLDYITEYRQLLCNCQNNGSDYTFCNLYGWADNYGLEWSFDGALCWIRQTKPNPVYWAPVGNWCEYDWKNCSRLDEGMSFIRVPEPVSKLWSELFPGRVQVTETRGQWDYLYSVEELAKLSGNKFHKKKNLLNQFKKNYDYTYHFLTTDCVESVLEMQLEWSKWREVEESPALIAENHAIKTILELWDTIPGLFGGAIHSEGSVIAYTVAEEMCPGTLVVHFEKGMPAYKGVYQAINNMFAEDVSNMGKYTLLNREQDLDDEGLRKAKESYNPVEYIRKNSVTILPA